MPRLKVQSLPVIKFRVHKFLALDWILNPFENCFNKSPVSPTVNLPVSTLSYCILWFWNLEHRSQIYSIHRISNIWRSLKVKINKKFYNLNFNPHAVGRASWGPVGIKFTPQNRNYHQHHKMRPVKSYSNESILWKFHLSAYY